MKIKWFVLMFFCVGFLLKESKGFEIARPVGYSKYSVLGAFGTDNALPFWLTANKNGIIPEHGFAMGYFSKKRNFANNFMWEASGAGYVGKESKLLINQLYIGYKWRGINFYLGSKNNDIKYDGLSSTNGDLLFSNNARAYPKYEVSVPVWKDIPFTKGIVSFKGILSDGVTVDNRYIDNARVHHKNLYVRIFKGYKLSASAGIEHYALWAGKHPEHGEISGSLGKYYKIFKVEGDDAGTFGNDSYRLGNHIGSYRFDIYFNSKDVYINMYNQTVFEDGSGKRTNSFPDGIWGIYFKNKGNRLLNSAVVEFYHTTDQSGRSLYVGDKLVGGNDNYFNHGEYRSGWTHFGRTIGSPLFTTSKRDGHTVIANNRFKALHLGVSGHLGQFPYKMYLTFSKNHGTNANPFASGPKQFSGYFELQILRTEYRPCFPIPFDIDLACAIDKGELLKDNIGFFVKLSRAITKY